MSQDATQTLLGASGDVFVAPLDTTAPDDATSSLDAAFVDLGYLTENGITPAFGQTLQDFGAWQNQYAIRSVATTRELTVAMELEQWNSVNVSFATGGGDWSSTADGFVLEPPDASVIDYRSMVFEWADGDRDFRLYIPKCLVSDNVQTQITRTALGVLPITVKALLVDSNTPIWSLFTDDTAAFEATAS